MQTWRAAVNQPLAHLGDDLGTECRDAGAIVTIRLKLLANPARNLGAAGIREAGQLAVVGNRHDARHDRNVHAGLAYALDEMEITVGVEEVLRDRAVGAGPGLAHEIVQVDVIMPRLGVRFRIRGHLDMEVVAGLVANELDEFVGIAQFTGGLTHAGGQVAAQGNNAPDAGFAILGQQVAQVVCTVAHTGQVRRCGHLHLLIQLQDGVARPIPCGASGTIGDGKEFGVVLSQHVGGCYQFLMPGVGLGREEFEADRVVFLSGHAVSRVSFKFQAASNKLSVHRAPPACSLQLVACS